MADDEPMLTIQVRLPRRLIERIDAYRLATTMRPSRSMMVRYLVENAMLQLEEREDNHDETS